MTLNFGENMALSDLEKILILAVVGIVGYVFLVGMQQPVTERIVPEAPGAPGSPGYQATLTFDSLNVYKAHAGTGAMACELWTSANNPQKTETAFDSSPDTFGNLPTTFMFGGYLLCGNDNFVSGTDYGAEIYLTKHSVSWVNEGDPHGGVVKFYNESSITWYGYDSGTLETTLNISSDAGEQYKKAELEIEADADACIGNPDFKKLALAVNCTDIATATKFDRIAPKSGWYTITEPLPQFLAGKAFIEGVVYVLPSDAHVCDSGNYRFPIIIEAKAGATNAASGDICYAHLLDWTYFKDDNNKPASGWEDQSTLAADTDIGIYAVHTTKAIAFT